MPEPVQDYTLEREKKTPEDLKQEAKEIPVYKEKLELTDEQKKRLLEEIEDEFDVLKQQREKGNDGGDLAKFWDALDNQYAGKLDEDTRRQFNINKNMTKVKINKAVNLSVQAFFETDPVFSISPRPEFAKTAGLDVCNKQQDFLDCELDNIPFENPVRLTFHSSFLKGTGILKNYHDIKRVNKRREERYKGEPGLVGTDTNGDPVYKNKGLEEFLNNWPDAPEKYPGFIKDLQEGKEITLIAEYKDTAYNGPRFKNIDLKNFYTRINTDGYEGLKTTKLIVERINYTYWELKNEEKEGYFTDIDKLIKDEKEADGFKKNYANKDWDILECTYFFRLNESDEPTKIVCWVSEEDWICIGAINYPFSEIECNYLPFYCKMVYPGRFYQPGMGEDLTDNNIAETAILNLALEGAYQNNLITPVTDNDDVITQFLENRFVHGLPINAKPGSIDFLQKYMKPVDIGGLISIMQYLVQGDDEQTGISSLMSGKESPLDPTAPASKTLALLQQSGVDVRAYIKQLIISFNEIGYILLAMYYQISKEGRKYAINPARIVGDNPFGILERNEMIARTNIHSQAYMHDFDKINSKREAVALYQLIRQEPLIAQDPEIIHLLLKTIIEHWGDLWKNLSNRLLPSLDEIKKKQAQTALMAVNQYIQMSMQKAKMTGLQPEFKIEELLPLVTDLVAQISTPMSPEQQKIAEKQNVQ